MKQAIKKKHFVRAMLGIMMFFALGFTSLLYRPLTANAAGLTTPNYAMQFDYTITTTTGTGGGTGQSTTTGRAYSVDTQVGAGSTITVTVSIYGSSASGSGSFPIGSYIRSSTVNLQINSSISQGSIYVTNSSGTEVGSGGKTLTLTGLSDGLYNVGFFFGSGAWATSARSGVGKSTSATSSFRVDTTAPTISGASTTTTGKCVNTGFTVSASDNLSGVENLYMKGPTDSSWLACGSSKTVSSGSTNGLYQFYAKDNAGNSSATYYVYYDTTKPTVTIKNASGTALTGTATNAAFYATASDTGCGVSYLQYKKPSDSSWQTYTSGTSIAATATNGTYMFRAVDKAGNISDTKTIILDTTKPTVTIYGESTTIANGGATNASYVQFAATDTLAGIKAVYVKLPGQSSYITYSAGTQYTTNGVYYIYCVDNADNQSATYTVTLDNVAPVLSCAQFDFYDTTEYDFTVVATDNVSSVTLYYKTPLMTDFAAASGNSYSVITTNSDGKYYFYTVDALGNRSETKWIELRVTAPIATIERDETTNQYRVTWDGTSTGRLNDEPYTKGTWITDEGEYTFVITNNSNRSTTYHFTVTHCFVVDHIVEPTCTERGYSVYKCLSCDITYNANYVDATGHDYDSVLVGETCTEGAYYLYTCKICGHQYQSDYITQGGHKYTTTRTAATCTERGYTTYTCSVCGYSFRDNYTAARGHSFRTTVIPATCTEAGHTHYECKNCDYEYDGDVVPAHGHNYETTVIEPTCTERGHTLHKCSYCGDEYRTDETFALGHNYTERTIDVSCTENGCVLHTCTRCGYEYETNVVQALGHKYVSEVTRQVTCDEDGNRHHICVRCGDQYDTEIPHFGHTFEIVDERNNGGTVVRTYKCEVCGYSYTQDLGDQYEEVSNYVEYLFQQYSPYMVYVFLATSGVWSIAMGIAYIIAKKNEEKEKAKKMLVNYGIGMIVIFAILIAAPLLVRGIAALIAG